MLNNSFYNEKDYKKIQILKNHIKRKLKNVENDKYLFNNILNYISLSNQYYIKVIENLEDLDNEVFNGYIINETEEKYIIERYNVITLNNDFIVGYRQNKKRLSKSVLPENPQPMYTFLVQQINKGYFKQTKIPIHNRTSKIIFYPSEVI